ncbi:hypothetical protein AVEN_275207-1 [Araneus ventricosus]|uniref:Uncharacterized protein n=1 Tax=Araneus ventricosus TaxID=182803 RepID=A0A4Y2NMI8_ARAVE|nr:hypothetical protein AVEN_275207-1 [Araneus ventricosus]
MSSLETLCHPHFQMHPVAMEILGLLQTLQHRGFCILFCWIPSHVGIAGNEQADHSAKTAASLLHREIPYCDVKKSVARRIFSLWQETWDLQVRNKLHYIKPFIGLWPVLPTRGADVTLTRLRIGHTRVTHKYLLFGERTPMCPTCLEEDGGLKNAGESSKSSDMLYSKAFSSDKEEELISASASDSRDCKSLSQWRESSHK